MISIRHRTASARGAANIWDYDPARRAVDIVMRLGSAEPLAFTVPVCALDTPRFGAYAITRFDADSWRILPSITVPNGKRLEPLAMAIHTSLDKGTSLVLTHSPEQISREIEALSA